jgi:hypothetical protein
MVEHSFRVGRYTCTATYDGPTPIIGQVGCLRVALEWSPAVPDFSRLTAEERKTYRLGRDTFFTRVMSAGVH